MVKTPPANAEQGLQTLGQERPLEKEMATHSSILAWEIPWTEEPGKLQSQFSSVQFGPQSSPNLCNLMNSVYAQMLQSCLTLCDPWTVACQAPLSMGFSTQEYWSGLPCPPPADLPDSGIETPSHMSPALAGGFFTTTATWEALLDTISYKKY